MRFCIDIMKYDGRRMHISGWAAPEVQGHEVLLTLKDQEGNRLPVSISKILREDVLTSLYGKNGTESYGFSFLLEGRTFRDLYLYMENPAIRVDHTRTILRLSDALAEYERAHRPLHTLKRYLLSKDKKNFRRDELFAGLDVLEKRYAVWYDEHRARPEELKRQAEAGIPGAPLVSVLVPVYRPDLRQLSSMIASVRKQSYPELELILASASPENAELAVLLKKLSTRDKRLRVLPLSENSGISGNTNAALKEARGKWIALLDQDDVLAPDALYKMLSAAQAEPAAEIVYSDEDKLEDETGIHRDPAFKTVFNDSLLHSTNYICHFLMVKKELAESAGGFRKEYDGAQDYDFVLRITELTRGPVLHVPEVLYSWRIHAGSTASSVAVKGGALDAGRRALQDCWQRLGFSADVTPIPELPGRYRTAPRLKSEPLVSVIIPNKDHAEELRRCVSSLLTVNTYRNLEILVVENNSTAPETRALYEELLRRDPRIRLLTWPKPFNYAAIQNFAAKEAGGEFLLLLNNDTEVIAPDFLKSMVFWGLQKRAGAVGARLFYEDGTVQHCGVLVLKDGAAHHVYLSKSQSEPGYMGRIFLPTDLSAVTAACMLVRKAAFEAVNGFEEQFTVAYNDVDFCLKLCEAGFRVIYDPEAVLTHFESKSRGYEDTEEKRERQKREAELLYARWPSRVGHDPFYSPNLEISDGWYNLP